MQIFKKIKEYGNFSYSRIRLNVLFYEMPRLKCSRVNKDWILSFLLVEWMKKSIVWRKTVLAGTWECLLQSQSTTEQMGETCLRYYFFDY